MIDPLHFRKLVVMPTLIAMGNHSRESENLLCGTALVESNLESLVQIPGCLAKGVFQCEPETYKDLRTRCKKEKPKTYKKICMFLQMLSLPENYVYLCGNMYAACAFARLKYLFDPDEIPKTIPMQAKYWNRVYNTTISLKEQERYIGRYSRAYS